MNAMNQLLLLLLAAMLVQSSEINRVDAVVLGVIESFLLPRESYNFKLTAKKYKNLKITGKLCLFPKQISANVFHDMDFFPPKKAITWENSAWISHERKENMVVVLQRVNQVKDPNKVFDEISEWNRTAESYGFIKEVLFSVLNAVDRKRKKKGNRILLHTAIEFNAPEDVTRLIKKNTGVNLEENSLNGHDTVKPLHHAVIEGRYEIVKILLETANAKVDTRDDFGKTPLHYAAETGRYEIVKFLLNGKNIRAFFFKTTNAKVDTRDDSGMTPLHYAAMYGRFDIVNFLLATNAKVDTRSKSGQTPLHYAAMYGRYKIVKFLLETANAKVGTRDKSGQTPLHYAAMYGRYAIVQFLLETANAKVDTRDDEYRTPLHYAVIEGRYANEDRYEIVKFLLETANAKVDTRDCFGKTPLYYAFVNDNIVFDNNEMIGLLCKNGANYKYRSQSLFNGLIKPFILLNNLVDGIAFLLHIKRIGVICISILLTVITILTLFYSSGYFHFYYLSYLNN